MECDNINMIIVWTTTVCWVMTCVASAGFIWGLNRYLNETNRIK